MVTTLTRHRRWRHKIAGYEVKVLQVLNYGPEEALRSTVTVDRTQHARKPRLWTAEAFLEAFDPIGRPQKEKTWWEML